MFGMKLAGSGSCRRPRGGVGGLAGSWRQGPSAQGLRGSGRASEERIVGRARDQRFTGQSAGAVLHAPYCLAWDLDQ